MASTFFGLQIATSGLFTARKQIDISGHNIANVNTPGYTRQRLMTESINPQVMDRRWAPIDEAHVGQGVESLSLDQIRNVFLDQRYRDQNSDTSYWNVKADELYFVEDVFYPKTGNNISQNLNSFFTAWNALKAAPNDIDARKILRQSGIGLTENFHTYSSKMNAVLKQQDDEFAVKVGAVNDKVKKIAELNDSIYRFELSGAKANDLRDKRNVLLDELSGLVNIQYREIPDALGYGRLQVSIPSASGNPPFVLVEHKDVNALTLSKNVTNPVTGETNTLNAINEIPYEDIKSGELRAHLDLRDGNSETNQGVPYYMNKLNVLVNALVKEVNALHSSGYTGSGTDIGVEYNTTTGVNFFDPATTSAADIKLDDAILQSVFNIAASTEPVSLVNGTYTGNNQIVLAMQRLNERTDIGDVSNFVTFFNSILGEMSVAVNHVNDMKDTSATLLDSIEDQRVSISGVSLDEEMTDLVRFQHAYNAASRVLTSMDECLDILITRTGVVGR